MVRPLSDTLQWSQTMHVRWKSLPRTLMLVRCEGKMSSLHTLQIRAASSCLLL
jgi:hypothetical protein